MELYLSWLNNLPEDFWFKVVAIVVILLILWLLKKFAGIFLTLLFLVIAILAGIFIINQEFFFKYYDKIEENQTIIPKESMHSFKEGLKEKYGHMKSMWDTHIEGDGNRNGNGSVNGNGAQNGRDSEDKLTFKYHI